MTATRAGRLRFKNMSGTHMPPGAFFGIGDYISDEGAYEAYQWNGELDRWGFNGQALIEDGGYGWFQRNQPEYIAYAPNAGSWDFGTNCGPQKDFWYLSNLGGGFRFYGEYATDDNADELATGIEYIGTDILKVKFNSMAPGGEQHLEYPRTEVNAEIYDYDENGDIVDIGRAVPVVNEFEHLSFADDQIGKIIWDKIEWHVLTADCPN